MHNPRLASFAAENLLEANIESLQQAMDTGTITSKDLTLMYLHRIATYDSINSVLEINPDAVQIAESLDLERKQKGARSSLHGIPILLKDNIDTGDKMHTSAGSLALENHVAVEDSFVAKQLREAGAVILGKTNMTEWANFMTDNMPSGYSSRGGQVLNPYGPGKFDVGGSSSGSGAAIAANFAVAAIGTETSGSILSPASSNSIVGIKPTVGLVSRTGIIPISHSQDTAGPMTRTVKDAAILLSVLSKKDERDPATLTNPYQHIIYTDYLKDTDLTGITIGVASEPFFAYLNEEERELVKDAITKLKELGATVIDSIDIPSAMENWDYNTLIYEFKTDLNAYLQNTGVNVPVSNLKELIDFNLENPSKMLAYGQTLLTKCEETSGTLTEAAYILSREKDIYFSQEQGIDAALQNNSLDAILFPNNFGAAIPAKAGYPSITVPGGYTSEGKPLGVTFTAGAFEEGKLIQIGYAYEQATQHRKVPELTEAE
ncbi:amidase [Sutcliffiella cohnii]|uniref:Amidase n=1 Tax=Sutcliffiella cohnii TaxID=33932 RepID=A0A223KKF9_9BACI|nr:amidase family protein [Sutcliffiella cohnii]AST89942.1 amidase [Sutcliffiella cohnii]